MKEPIFSFKRDKLSTFIITIVIILCMFLLETYFLLLKNIDAFFLKLKQEIKIECFLSSNIGKGVFEKVYEKLNNNPYVERINFVSKEEALKKIQQDKDFRELTNHFSFNPCPDGFEVFFKQEFCNKENIEIFIKEFKIMQGIEDIIYPQEYLSKLFKFLEIFKDNKIIIGIILISILLLIITFVMKLYLIKKEQDLKLLTLFGAKKLLFIDHFFIYTFILGIIGTLVSLLLIYCLYYIIVFNTTMSIIFLSLDNIIYSFGLGIFLSIISGLFSILIILTKIK